MCKGENDTSDQIQQAVLLCELRDTNSASVSSTPACLHCYLDKAQFGLLKSIHATGILSFSVNFKNAVLALCSTHHNAFPAVNALPWICECPGKCSTQNLNRCLLFVSWRLFCQPSCPLSNSLVISSGRWSKTIVVCALCLEIVPYVFSLIFFCFVQCSFQCSGPFVQYISLSLVLNI